MTHGCEWKCSSECKKVACTTGHIFSLLFTAGFIYCCSVIQLCPTLCDPMDFSMPGFPVLHYLLEFAQTHVHCVGNAIQPISFSVILFFSCLQSFTASGPFPVSQIFASCGQSTGASASASVLPRNIQSWFPLGLTGLIYLPAKGLSRVFASTTVQKHQFFDMGLITVFLVIMLVILMTMEGKLKSDFKIRFASRPFGRLVRIVELFKYQASRSPKESCFLGQSP